MKRQYWEQMASRYNDEIFDVRRHDKKALVTRAIKKYAQPSHRVIDIGCAIGKWFSVLSPLFNEVIALDIAAENLRLAQAQYASLSNITYRQLDMSKAGIRLPKCEMGICINAILTPDAKDRQRFFNNLSRCIVRGGKLIATVPSLESFLLTQLLQQEYKIEPSLFPAVKQPREGLKLWNQLLRGVAEIDRVPHKHFLADELVHLFDRAGFSTLQLQKIEYPWTTEFNHSPRWLRTARPWDWMIVLEKIR